MTPDLLAKLHVLYLAAAARARHLEPLSRHLAALEAVGDALLADHPTIEMQAVFRRGGPDVGLVDELGRRREQQVADAVFAELEAAHRVTRAALCDSDQRRRDLCVARDHAKWLMLERGLKGIAIARVFDCAESTVSEGRDRHERRLRAAAARAAAQQEQLRRAR